MELTLACWHGRRDLQVELLLVCMAEPWAKHKMMCISEKHDGSS